jgi:hypothetical protein
MNKDDFNMQIMDDFDFIIEEKGNSFTALRKLRWSDKSATKLDIRKYMIDSDGNEVIGKGIGFMTEEGPHELVKVMTENGYGKTKEILVAIKDREDFMPSLSKVLSNSQMDELSEENPDLEFPDDKDEEVYYDPRELVVA